MKNGLSEIIGKQIVAVVVAESQQNPHHQVFLIFPDGTRFEFYGGEFSCCSGLDKAERVIEYVESGAAQVVKFFGDDELNRRNYSPVERAKRYMAAWSETWKVVAKAQE